MDLLILIIIIAVVISKSSKKKTQKKPSTVTQVNKNAKNRQRQQEQELQRQRQQLQRQQEWDSNRQIQEMQKQRDLKQRLEKKYHQKTADGTGTILDRAIGNVADETKDVMKTRDAGQHIDAVGSTTKELFVGEITDGNALMDQVYDLMVTGYSGAMHFERDFLAEGMDMLNRIQG